MTIDELLSKAQEKRKEGEKYKNLACKCFDDSAEYLSIYRIESLNRVLDFIRSEYRAGRVCDLEALLCHCQNKLNGNIDGVELSLNESYRGVPFRKEGEADAE